MTPDNKAQSRKEADVFTLARSAGRDDDAPVERSMQGSRRSTSFNIGRPSSPGQYLLLDDNSLVFEARVNEDETITAASFENGTVVPFEVPKERVRGWALCAAVK